jgi:hypothetical protein
MTQALYAHMNNKTIKKRKKIISWLNETYACVIFFQKVIFFPYPGIKIFLYCLHISQTIWLGIKFLFLFYFIFCGTRV